MTETCCKFPKVSAHVWKIGVTAAMTSARITKISAGPARRTSRAACIALKRWLAVAAEFSEEPGPAPDAALGAVVVSDTARSSRLRRAPRSTDVRPKEAREGRHGHSGAHREATLAQVIRSFNHSSDDS